MPAAFNKCVKQGGKVITKSFGKRYMHICYLNGKSYAGEMKMTKGGVNNAKSKKSSKK